MDLPAPPTAPPPLPPARRPGHASGAGPAPEGAPGPAPVPALAATPPPPPGEAPRAPQILARAVLGIAFGALALWTLRTFLPALAWAGIFAIATWPLYQRMQHRFPPGRHNILLPSLFTLGIALLFLVPLGLVGMQFGREAHGIFRWIHEAQTNGIPVPSWLGRLPAGSQQATTWWQENLADPHGATRLLGRINRAEAVAYSREFGAQLLHRAVLFGFTLLTLFFLFRDGATLTGQLMRVGHRAFGPRGERVGRQIVASVHGTVDGLVLVGLGEGVLLGIAYAVAGVPHPTLLGALTALAAMIPLGAPLVFCLAALLLVVQGSTTAAIAIVVLGVVVTFVADHFVRPVLIGGATRLPFLWVLLGILGGVETWGLLGLFLGPAIMAAVILLWREWANGPGTGAKPAQA